MISEIALVGNPNSGKTTLYNALTGKAEKVGNWSGVTVNAISYPYKKNKSVIISDLPGCYSFSGTSKDELAVKEYFSSVKPRAIINVIDGLNLERSLFLTCILTELKIPMVIAINMADDLKKSGVKINKKLLEETFNSPVVEISALKNYGIDTLVKTALQNENIPNINKSVINGQNVKPFLKELTEKVISKKIFKIEKFTLKADKLLLGKFTAFPIFFIIIFLVYFLSVKLGGEIGSFLGDGFNFISLSVKNSLLKTKFPIFLTSLLTDGIMSGICSVLSFLPQIILLFFLIGILEQSGYMSRASFILDSFFGVFNLSGRAVIPLVLSSGCTVTGISSCRAVESSYERERLIYISPFIPCSAKSAVFGWFSYNIFGGSAFVATSLYFLGIVFAIIFSLFTRSKNNKDASFVFEIPYLRLPSFYTLFSVVKHKIKDFLVKAGSVILIISIAVWLLSRLGPSGYVGECTEKSFLFYLGNILKYLFIPLGFGSWQASVSLLSGIFAKEAVVESLQILSGSSVFLNGASAYSYLIFILLSPPCVASLVNAKKELNDNKSFIRLIVFEFVLAYSSSLIFYNAYRLCFFYNKLIFVFIIVIIITLAITFSVFKGKNLCKKYQNLN